MSDPLRLDPVRAADAADGDKEARIEQLLLAGLDHYFAGQYEQAINVWTRVIFLERGHDRARAYIERARGALAERHRESEELLHRGVAAFDRGETSEARELLTRAVEQGAQQDMALVFLERLNRLGGPAPSPESVRASAADLRPRPAHADPADTGSWVVRAIAIVALIGAAFAGLVLGGVPVIEWISGDAVRQPAEQVFAAPPEPLPIVRSSEMVLARARSLQAGGHLRDALAALDTIDLADPLRGAADVLKADVQRQLLEAGRAAGPGGGAP
jgi:hypothetical protein